MYKKGFAVLLVLWFSVTAALSANAVFNMNGDTYYSEEAFLEETAYFIWMQTNAARESNGLPALPYLTEAQALADHRAQEIISDFSHSGMDPALETFGFQQKMDDGEIQAAGENIAWNSCFDSESTAQEIMTGWLGSTGHRANILDTQYGFNGMVVGVAVNNEKVYAVQLFFTCTEPAGTQLAAPKTLAPAPTVQPTPSPTPSPTQKPTPAPTPEPTPIPTVWDKVDRVPVPLALGGGMLLGAALLAILLRLGKPRRR